MNILILGGRSKRHYEWVRELASEFTDSGLSVVHYDYKHWQTGADEVNIPAETERIAGLVTGLGDYIIVAKSIGTVIATLGVKEGKFKPAGCVLLGVPVEALGDDLPAIGDALASLPRTIFIQNENDPLGAGESLREYLMAHTPTNWKLVITPGNTHDYVDFRQIFEIVKSFTG